MPLYAYNYYLDVLAVIFVQKRATLNLIFQKKISFSYLPKFNNKENGT